MENILSGSCLCQAVKIKVKSEEKEFHACHCGMCRKWGGSPLFTVDAGTHFDIEGEDSVTRYDSSEWAERAFCNKCGTHLFYKLKESGYSNVSLGLFENMDDFKFTMQIFTDSKPSCYAFSNETKMMTEAEVLAYFSQSQS